MSKHALRYRYLFCIFRLWFSLRKFTETFWCSDDIFCWFKRSDLHCIKTTLTLLFFDGTIKKKIIFIIENISFTIPIISFLRTIINITIFFITLPKNDNFFIQNIFTNYRFFRIITFNIFSSSYSIVNF